MRKIFAIPALVLGAVLFFFIGGPVKTFAYDQSGPIRFGVYPYESARALYNLYAPLARRIEEKTGRRVELVSAPDQQAFIGKADQGDYDLALVSPVCFFKIQAAGYQVIARGEPPFHGAAIVRGDSGITGPEQLRGKKIAAIGKYSYGGYLFFRQELAALGISPDRDVTFTLLDKVDSVIFSVINKQHDAGVIRLDTLNRPAFAPVRDMVRIITRSAAIPQFPFVAKKDLGQDTVQAIRDVLTAITPGNAEDGDILQSLQIERIVAAQDADYDAFRQVLKQAEH
jgi:phosphonate transport system substrate-binding protein